MRLGLRNIGLDPERDVSLRVVGATNLRMITMQQGQAQFTVISSTEREEAEKLGIQSPGRSRQQKDSLSAQRPDQQSKIAAREARRHAALRARIGRGDSLF